MNKKIILILGQFLSKNMKKVPFLNILVVIFFVKHSLSYTGVLVEYDSESSAFRYIYNTDTNNTNNDNDIDHLNLTTQAQYSRSSKYYLSNKVLIFLSCPSSPDTKCHKAKTTPKRKQFLDETLCSGFHY